MDYLPVTDREPAFRRRNRTQKSTCCIHSLPQGNGKKGDRIALRFAVLRTILTAVMIPIRKAAADQVKTRRTRHRMDRYDVHTGYGRSGEMKKAVKRPQRSAGAAFDSEMEDFASW